MKNVKNIIDDDEIESKLLLIKSHREEIKLKEIQNKLNFNKINLHKSRKLKPLKLTRNFLNINSYIKTLKKNNSQISEEKKNFPLLNSNNKNNTIDTTNRSKISFSPLSKNNHSLNKDFSLISLSSNPIKSFKKKPIKLQFFSRSINSPLIRNNSNLQRNILSPKVSKLVNSKNIIFSSPSSETREITKEENSINHNISNNNIDQEQIQIKKRINKFKPFGFSPFFNLSKNSDISARSIYQHYLIEEMNDEAPSLKEGFTKYIIKKFKSPRDKLNVLYGLNEGNIRRIKELKANKFIVFKKDFKLKEYQKILCGMIKKRCSNDSIIYLKKKYEKFNDEMKSYKKNHIHKGRYAQLADKIRKNAPNYLLNRLKKLDQENLISKAKYFHVDVTKSLDEIETETEM